MSNDFATIFKNAFLDAPEFADEVETLTYRPAAGGTRSIKAYVMREVPAAVDENRRHIAPVITIEVANDSTDGISSSELNEGGDKIDVALDKGGSAQTRPITQLLEHDAGYLRLRVR